MRRSDRLQSTIPQAAAVWLCWAHRYNIFRIQNFEYTGIIFFRIYFKQSIDNSLLTLYWLSTPAAAPTAAILARHVTQHAQWSVTKKDVHDVMLFLPNQPPVSKHWKEHKAHCLTQWPNVILFSSSNGLLTERRCSPYADSMRPAAAQCRKFKWQS